MSKGPLYFKSLMYLLAATGTGYILLNLTAPSEDYKKQLSNFGQTEASRRREMEIIKKALENRLQPKDTRNE